MNIVMLVLNNITYDARVHKQAVSLSRAGYSVTVIGLLDDASPSREEKNGYSILRLKIRSFKGSSDTLTQFFRYLEFNLLAVMTILSLHPEVCHAHALQALPACWLAAAISRCKLIYDSHEFEQGQDFSAGSRIPRLMQLLWVWPEKLFIHSADAVLTVSESLADALVRTYRIEKPLVIRNCPERSSLDSPVLQNNKHDVEIPPGWPVILYQGILSQGRGLSELIRSADYMSDLVLLFVGDGILFHELQQAAHSIMTNVRCIFTGKVAMEELPSLTMQANIGVILTQNTCQNHYYSLPNKLFEYLQAGLPVIGSNLPEIAHIIEENKVGVIVNPQNPQDIATGIKQLLDNKVYSKAKQNTVRAAEIYNWENESGKLIKLYQDIALKA